MKKLKQLFKHPIEKFFSIIKRKVLLLTFYFHKSYQPIGDKKIGSSLRPNSAFMKRLEILESEIKSCKANNLLDIGCAEGFFVRQTSLKNSLFSIGVDGSLERIEKGVFLSQLNHEEGYGFVLQMLTPEKISRLPKFDIVVCFSLLHHVISQKGRREGLNFLKACNGITKKQFIFDMGSPDEILQPWAKDLNFLQGDVVANIKSYLEEAGFANIKCVGESLGHRGEAVRPIFLCCSSDKNICR